MDFYEVLEQVLVLLQRHGRLSYRALKLQFQLDDEYLDTLKEELIDVQKVAIDQDDRMLILADDARASSKPDQAASTSEVVAPASGNQKQKPLSYTPQHLAEKILTSRSALEGERKQVTVCFADIKDSTELIKDLDPEDAQNLLDPAIHIMMDAVHRFEGTVNQVLGDGIMAIFGAPIAHEDHAVRACYTALAMQAAMRDYTEEVRRSRGLTLRIRVGLNSGEVVVRTIGNDLHMDYSAVGQTTHLASRMEQLADPGSIILTASTLRLVEGMVQVNALGPIPIKGVTEPVEVCELTGASTIRRRLQAAVARGLSKFVGREMEIDTLDQALAQAEAGYGQVVAAVGEAGVGKSRLMYEFIHAHRSHGRLILESASVSYGKATSYLPVTDLLRGYFEVDSRDTVQRIREKINGKILTLDEQLKDVIAPMLWLLGTLPEDDPLRSLDPPYRRSLVLDAFKRLFVRESQRQPLLLVFEDLHWVDDESQTALDTLVDSLPTSRMLLLTNYRPGYDDHWTTKTFYTRLRIDPLPPQDADELLADLLGGDAALQPLKTMLKERTAGNPFFLEESVRTLVETGVLAGQPSAYRLTHDLSSLQIPATVQALLAARIDRLPFEEKQLLQSASVIGMDVPLTLLQDIASLSEGDLRRALTNLQTAEFLYETRLFPDSEYTFKHALTHDVAYESLLHERRRTLHRQVGQAIESRYADRLDDFADMLANQFERGEDWGNAVHYHLHAAEKMKAQYAYQRAVELCTHALDLVTLAQGPGAERIRGLVLLGDLWSLLGEVELANQSYEQSLQEDMDATARQIIANKRHQPHTVVRDGARIAFYEHGSGDLTLVLAHPTTYGLATFQPLVERLCQEFRIITIDPRGTGSSDALPPRYTLRERAEDVRAVIEASWTGPVVAVGGSRGGTLMMVLAATYPALVHQLVLISSHAAPSVTYAQLEWVDEARACLREGDQAQALGIIASAAFSEPGTRHLAETFVESRLHVPTDMLLDFLTPNPEDDVVALLPHIQMPTLVIHGTADRYVPFAMGQYLAEHIHGAQFYTLQGKGHGGGLFTATHELCEVLRCFVRTGKVS